MSLIPIKINKKTDPEADRLNAARAAKKNRSKPGRKFLLWLVIIIAIFEAGIISFLLLYNTDDHFEPLIPNESVSVIYFKQSSLGSLTRSLNDRESNRLPINLEPQIFFDFMDKNNLDANQIKSFIKDEMALILLTGNDQANPRWLLLGGLNESSANFKIVLENAAKSLKRDFNLISEIYRQIEIIQAKPLDKDHPGAYFAQPKNLFILGNDPKAIKEVIDKALE